MKIKMMFDKDCVRPDSIAQHVDSHLEKILKFEYSPMSLDLHFSVSGQSYRVEAHIKGKQIDDFLQADGDDFYVAADLLCHKLEKVLRKLKEKTKKHKKPERAALKRAS